MTDPEPSAVPRSDRVALNEPAPTGQLVAEIAHDVNNALTAINGYADLILEALPPDDPLRPDVEEIRRAGESGRQLIRRLSAVAGDTPHSSRRPAG